MCRCIRTFMQRSIAIERRGNKKCDRVICVVNSFYREWVGALQRGMIGNYRIPHSKRPGRTQRYFSNKMGNISWVHPMLPRQLNYIIKKYNHMGIIIWIVFGAIVGWVASMVMGSKGGLLRDIIVGIVGAVLGGFIMGLFGYGDVSGFNLYSFFVALVGACVLIAIVRAVQR
jgi:uncharacterized membrane protein YeaQ/YmgE (transglycosylase-associated protein family)